MNMKHKEFPGQVSTVTERQFERVWRPKGWEACDEHGNALDGGDPDQPVDPNNPSEPQPVPVPDVPEPQPAPEQRVRP